MAKEKVLIAVKTYPTLSQKYGELVCTAGFKEDGTWIRIYPVPFRQIESKYRKWQWIELDLAPHQSDIRKESFRPTDVDDIVLGDFIDSKLKGGWEERKRFALRKVYTNMDELIKEAKNRKIGTSLAVFKPTDIIDFIWEPCERNWNEEKVKALYAKFQMKSLFDEEENEIKKYFKLVDKVPYEFSYVFKSEDGKDRTLMIEDWEVGALYHRYITQYNFSEEDACKKVKEKYFEYFAKTKDIYLFLGTTQKHHFHSKNPFIIIGTFTPPKVFGPVQTRLDLF